MSTDSKAFPCKYCDTPTAPSDTSEEIACPPCREFKRRAEDMLKKFNTTTGFYKIIHEVLEPFQMVCVSKTILPGENNG